MLMMWASCKTALVARPSAKAKSNRCCAFWSIRYRSGTFHKQAAITQLVSNTLTELQLRPQVATAMLRWLNVDCLGPGALLSQVSRRMVVLKSLLLIFIADGECGRPHWRPLPSQWASQSRKPSSSLLFGYGSFSSLNKVILITWQGPYNKGVEWPMMMMAIIASVIQALGLIPPYFELAKRNGRVIGISNEPASPLTYGLLIGTDFIFLTVDWAGAFFSLMALGDTP